MAQSYPARFKSHRSGKGTPRTTPYSGETTLNFMADMGGVLADAGIDDETIESIKKTLSGNETLIHDNRPVTSTSGSFGGSSAGSYLDTQASIAHQHVTDALTEMVTGLAIYRSNLSSFQKGMEGADTDQQQAFEQVRHGVESAEHYTTKGDFTHRQGGA